MNRRNFFYWLWVVQMSLFLSRPLEKSFFRSLGQGNSGFGSFVVGKWVVAGGTLTETQPIFEQIEYTIRPTNA